mmetsp:Transcript_7061/g.20509  ORF Transcript_7061/g.20509 Transcript_7061/m.20509 type:complete len:263 (-) Transcript_7061:1220-2008(-)
MVFMVTIRKSRPAANSSIDPLKSLHHRTGPCLSISSMPNTRREMFPYGYLIMTETTTMQSLIPWHPPLDWAWAYQVYNRRVTPIRCRWQRQLQSLLTRKTKWNYGRSWRRRGSNTRIKAEINSALTTMTNCSVLSRRAAFLPNISTAIMHCLGLTWMQHISNWNKQRSNIPYNLTVKKRKDKSGEHPHQKQRSVVAVRNQNRPRKGTEKPQQSMRHQHLPRRPSLFRALRKKAFLSPQLLRLHPLLPPCKKLEPHHLCNSCP